MQDFKICSFIHYCRPSKPKLETAGLCDRCSLRRVTLHKSSLHAYNKLDENKENMNTNLCPAEAQSCYPLGEGYGQILTVFAARRVDIFYTGRVGAGGNTKTALKVKVQGQTSPKSKYFWCLPQHVFVRFLFSGFPVLSWRETYTPIADSDSVLRSYSYRQ